MLPVFYSENLRIESIPVTDRSIHYGDGLFETIAVENSKPQFLKAHLERLQRACRALKIPEIPMHEISQQIDHVLKTNRPVQAVLKIIVTRGSGGRAYSPPQFPGPCMILGLYPWPAGYLETGQRGAKVFLCDTRLAYNKALAGIKHLNRLEQVLARLEFSQEDYDEGLMFDTENNLIEGTMSNVFIHKNNTWMTPKVNRCGVAGIIRNSILSLAPTLGHKCREAVIGRKQLFDCEEIFLCNSIMKIWPVNQIMEHRVEVGEKTKNLIRAFTRTGQFNEIL